MVRNIYINGQIKTLLVLQDEISQEAANPVYQALKEQAERIDMLEEQNQTLIQQGEVLLKLLEISAETGNMLSQSLNALSIEEEDEEFLTETQELEEGISEDSELIL